MIIGTARISEVLFDIEDCFTVEKAVQEVGSLAFCRADWQYAELTVLIGQ